MVPFQTTTTQRNPMMTSLEHAPNLTTQTAEALAAELYGLDAGASAMPSDRDQNFLLHTTEGEKYVLKIANAKEDWAVLEAQNEMMMHVATRISERETITTHVIPTLTGECIAEIKAEAGARLFARLVTYIEGKPMAEVRRHSQVLLQDVGHCLAEVSVALRDFDHPALHRTFVWDLANALDVVQAYRPLITEPDLGGCIDLLVNDFERHTVPLLPKLRRSIIHGDANDYNVIVGGGEDLTSRYQQLVGLIDYGDMVYSYTVADPAIAAAYALLDKPDPLAAAADLIQGYHTANPLIEEEIGALYGLIVMRLCVSACMAARQQQQRPDDPYLGISQQPIRSTLPTLASISYRFAIAHFRHACGFSPSPNSERVCNWLQENAGSFEPILGVYLGSEPLHVVDLSVDSPLLEGDMTQNSEPLLSERIVAEMDQVGADVGIGRYDEVRYFYTTDAFATGDDLSSEHRTVHLGVDLFVEAGSPVCAPISGVVHAFANNASPFDYGPVLILQHQIDPDVSFYTLYGHLSERSLAGLKLAQRIDAGEIFAATGAAAVNGGWTPHLHFQLITDLLGLSTDYPGVCRFSERPIWHSLSPDPTLLLGIPGDMQWQRRPSKRETLQIRNKVTGRNLDVSYNDPVKIVRGAMQYLFDESGRRYIDAYNNVPHVGHCHPRIVEAGIRQMKVLNTNTRYLHDTLNRYAERLIATLPEPLSLCFFVNSGSEANELAMRLARSHSGERHMIVLEGAYHGHTTSLIDISPYKHDGPGGMGAPEWVHTVPVADVYRGAYKADDPLAGTKYAAAVQSAIETLQSEGRDLAGFIAESCPSVGGQIIFPEGYLAATFEHVRAQGGLCIMDEVQTGYGRIGSHFYAFEAQQVVPDIVVLGKPIGNGYPIGAVITTPEIAASFDNGMEFFSTFGGSTVSCAIGLAVLETVIDEDMQSHALAVGDHMLARLRSFIDRYALVGDVRGSGLFLGLELVRDRETLEPADTEAPYISNRMRDHGILLGSDGPYHNVIKIRPPMPFSTADADRLIFALNEILAEVENLWT